MMYKPFTQVQTLTEGNAERMPLAPNLELTTGEKETLAAHTNYVLTHGYPPTLRELAKVLGVHWTGVRYRLKKLHEKGAIADPGVRRKALKPITSIRLKVAKGKR